MAVRMTEKEAVKRGLIPPPEPKIDPAMEERAKQLALDTINKHRQSGLKGDGFITTLAFIIGWLAGFVCALLFNPYSARLLRL